MDYFLRSIYSAVLMLSLIACQGQDGSHSGNGKTNKPTQELILCDARQKCLTNDEIVRLRKMSNARFELLTASFKTSALSEEDATRLKALSLNDAYETIFDRELVDESNEFIIELFITIFEKENA